MCTFAPITPPQNTTCLPPNCMDRCREGSVSTDAVSLSCPRRGSGRAAAIHPSPRTQEFFATLGAHFPLTSESAAGAEPLSPEALPTSHPRGAAAAGGRSWHNGAAREGTPPPPAPPAGGPGGDGALPERRPRTPRPLTAAGEASSPSPGSDAAQGGGEGGKRAP